MRTLSIIHSIFLDKVTISSIKFSREKEMSIDIRLLYNYLCNSKIKTRCFLQIGPGIHNDSPSSSATALFDSTTTFGYKIFT